MQTPPEIVFTDFDVSDAVRKRVEDEIAKLEQFYDRIVRCRVAISAPGMRHRKGGLYTVRIHLTLPGHGEIDVNRNHPGKHHDDIYVAIRDAFAAARRQLQDKNRERQGKVKQHEVPPSTPAEGGSPDER